MDIMTQRRNARGKAKRRERMEFSRSLGTHTKEEWLALKMEFAGKCVRCGTGDLPVEKDHIIPIYQGGSDSIENIQPICSLCNVSKGPETFDWKTLRREQ